MKMKHDSNQQYSEKTQELQALMPISYSKNYDFRFCQKEHQKNIKKQAQIDSDNNEDDRSIQDFMDKYDGLVDLDFDEIDGIKEPES